MSFLNFWMLLFAVLFGCAACSKGANSNQGSIDDHDIPPHLTVTVTTVAGKVGDKGNAEDGNGANARFWNPTKMIFDSRNNTLYIADGSAIRSMDAQNNVHTYVPVQALGRFNDIYDLALAPGSGGTLYMTTKENDLWKIETSGEVGKATSIINRVYRGNAVGPLNSGDHFDFAKGLATGADGDIYFFNQSYNTMHRIRLTSLNSGTVEPFAGKPLSESGGNGHPYPFADGSGEEATFSGRVQDLASDANGNIYVADYDNNIVRKVTPEAKVTSLIPFTSHVGMDIDGSIGSVRANGVTQVAVTGDGSSVFFTTLGNAGNNHSALRLLHPGKNVITLVGYEANSSYGDGNGATAGLGEIGGIACTPDGKTIYVAEPGMKVIRKVVIQ